MAHAREEALSGRDDRGVTALMEWSERHRAGIVDRHVTAVVQLHGMTHNAMPRSNAEFWQAKFDANVIRDRRANETLASRGRRVRQAASRDNSSLRWVTESLFPIFRVRALYSGSRGVPTYAAVPWPIVV
jgi:hypothetical protein